MFKSICSRAIRLVSTQAVTWGRDAFRRSLNVLMLLVTASVMLNLAMPVAARAAATPPVLFFHAIRGVSICEGAQTNPVFQIINQSSLAPITSLDITAADGGSYNLPAGVSVSSYGVIDNSCGVTVYNGSGGALAPGDTSIRITGAVNLAHNALCTVIIEIVGTPGDYVFPSAKVAAQAGSDDVAYTTTPPNHGLNIYPHPIDPTPTLTFSDAGPVYVALNGTGTNLATSTITGIDAGTINYASSDPSIATVDFYTGEYTGLHSGEVTITATQPAAARFNPHTTPRLVTVRQKAGLISATVCPELAAR